MIRGVASERERMPWEGYLIARAERLYLACLFIAARVALGRLTRRAEG